MNGPECSHETGTRYQVEWCVSDDMPDGGDFDPALCEYQTATYRTLEGALRRGDREAKSSPWNWFVIYELERRHIADGLYDWERVASYDEAGQRSPY